MNLNSKKGIAAILLLLIAASGATLQLPALKHKADTPEDHVEHQSDGILLITLEEYGGVNSAGSYYTSSKLRFLCLCRA